MASEPVSKPITAFAAVSPADAAIDPSAALSLSFMQISWRSPILLHNAKQGNATVCTYSASADLPPGGITPLRRRGSAGRGVGRYRPPPESVHLAASPL